MLATEEEIRQAEKDLSAFDNLEEDKEVKKEKPKIVKKEKKKK
jgi:hypothetical protein